MNRISSDHVKLFHLENMPRSLDPFRRRTFYSNLSFNSNSVGRCVGTLCVGLLRWNTAKKTTLLTSIFFLLTSVFYASWYYADGFCRCLIRMLPDVRWVGFLPPYKDMGEQTTRHDLRRVSEFNLFQFIVSVGVWEHFEGSVKMGYKKWVSGLQD
jgi:hypothetical protein